MNYKSASFIRRALTLGAINGLVFGTLLQVVMRITYYYVNHEWLPNPTPSGSIMELIPYPFPWWYIPLLAVTLFIPASLLVHYILAHRIKSPIWLWQIIGLVAFLTYYTTILIRDLRHGIDFEDWYYWRSFESMWFEIWLAILAGLAIFNLALGLLLRRSARRGALTD